MKPLSKVLILAGGRGTRLRPLTFAIPKPLVPIVEKPIIEVLIRRLYKQGIREFYISVGYKMEIIKTYLNGLKFDGVKFVYIEESAPLGTCGPLKLLQKADHLSQDDNVLLINGDIVTKISIEDMLSFHYKVQSVCTVATRTTAYRLPYGVIEYENGKLMGVREKPSYEYRFNAGIYIVNESVLNLIPDGENFDMPQLLNMLLARNSVVGCYEFSDQWLAIDDITSIEHIHANKQVWLEPDEL